MPKIISYISLLICLVCAGAAPVYASAPEDCLTAIAEAVDNGDLESFDKLVDMDAVLSQGLDTLMAELGKQENAAQFGPMIALMFSQATGKGGEALRKLLVQELRAFVSNGVASGSFAGKQLQAPQPQGMLAPLFANASTGKKEIRDIGQSMRDGNDWIAPFSIHDYGNGHDYPVIGRFTPVDGGARLVKVENIDQIFRQIQKEAAGQ